MGLNDTPSAQRVHIGFFGMRNAGKSSVVNAVTNQEISVVSDVLGTTTDPVRKAMELLPIGPVEIVDTPGFDDVGELGELRIKRTKQILNKTDVAVLVVDASVGKTACDVQLIDIFTKKEIPYLVAYNKSDIKAISNLEENEILISAKTKENIDELKNKISRIISGTRQESFLLKGIVKPDEFVVLVIPIDEAAPKGRLILPQQQTIRELLEIGAYTVCVKDTEYEGFLKTTFKKPDLVICDSQVFKFVDEKTPKDIKLTSFSILFARLKGDLKTVVEGAKMIDRLSDGDCVLISEGCTHHRQCNDIGSVKLPNLIKKYTDKTINFEFTSGNSFVEDFSKYKLIIHCGACMLNEREMKYRIKTAIDSDTPITNYGISIAYMNGILKRSTDIFPELSGIFN